MYGLADTVFVGGSLVPAGGHNIFEPAWFGRPPVFGPHMDNFRDAAQLFLKSGAGIEVKDAADLAAAWEKLLSNQEEAARMGTAARQLLEESRGATERVLHRIAGIIQAGSGKAAMARGVK